ncbi:hypothetical protein AB0D38_05550 [Streptomyces sp. NPDC048279]|uniref:hypothetical protein n=1 Tax=Streptomyces sp. NPDC048279 TaxID=3154714 RepID=UPI003438623C
MDELREEADRIGAELAAAERDWQEWTIARQRVGVLLSAPGDVGATAEAPASSAAAPQQKSQVPVWRDGLARSALSAGYQRILQALADRVRLGQGPLTCQELAAGFGMDLVPVWVEALRSKAKRLVACGWAVEPVLGRFTLAQGVAGPDGAS